MCVQKTPFGSCSPSHTEQFCDLMHQPFPTPASYLTPAGCPTLHFGSDAVDQELGQSPPTQGPDL